MPLETGTYISDLNASNPVGASDTVSSLDDHARLIKSTLLNTFPNVTGAMNASHTELNNLVGITGKTGTGNVVLSASPTFTGTMIAAAITASGTITGNLFSGSGASLTALNASNLASGTVPIARIPQSSIDHDSLSGFVANEHINHSSVDIIAGNGLTGGGDITQDRTLNVVGGDGITANANDIAVDSSVIRTTGNQTIGGTKTFSSNISMSGTRAIDATTRLNLTGATVSAGESGGNLGFFGSAGTTKKSIIGTITGDGDGKDVLQSLLVALDQHGFITNNVSYTP